MADSKLYIDTETKDSDEILELFCEECLKDGNNVDVCAYCSDCDEYFCTLCQKYHAKFLKDHKILDGDNMPKDVEWCRVHKQIIKLYCSTCEKFACCMCTTHSSLTSAGKLCKLTSLAELTKDIEQSVELTNFIANLDKIVSKSVNMKQNEPEIENIAAQAKQEVQKYQDKILAKVEQMNGEIDKRKQTDSDKYQTISAKSNALVSRTKEVSNKIKQKHSNVRTQRSQMFIVMKKMKSEIESLDTEIDEITAEMDKLKYIFKTDMSIIHATEEKQDLTLKSETITEQDFVQIEKRKIAVYQYEIFKKDNEIKPTDFCVLPGQILAVCHSNEKSVKLFNARERSVIATLQMKTSPTAITYIENRQFAVAQHSRKNETAGTITFMFWSKKDKLSFYKRKHFEVESECLGITHVPNKQRLIVLLCDGGYGKVQIIDMFGRILETFPTYSTGSSFFSNYTWMTLDKKQNILYASTQHLDRLTTIHLDMEEENDNRIKYSFLIAPNGIACDNQGFIYASLHGQHNVIYFDPENSEESEDQDILTENDDIFAPGTIKYCDEDNLLYVDDLNSMKVFKIMEKECVWKETLQKVWKWEPIF